MKKFLLITLLSFFINNYSEVLIITTAFNKPEFIELQYKTFKKFLKDDYEFIVFNDANEESFKSAIENECKKYGIKSYIIPQEIHKPSALVYDYLRIKQLPAFRCGENYNYLFKTLGFNHNDILVIIDSDCFLTRDFSIRNFLGDCQISGKKRNRPLGVIPHTELAIFDMPKLPHKKAMMFDSAFLGHNFTDPFGLLDIYLYFNPQVRLKWLEFFTIDSLIEKSKKYNLSEKGFLKDQIEFIKLNEQFYQEYEVDINTRHNCGFFQKAFLNFRAGRRGHEAVVKRAKLYRDYLLKIVS